MAETLHQIARFLIPTWPLLAACLLALLPEKRAAGSARLFALTGLALTVLLTPLVAGQDLITRWTWLLAASVPFLSWREGSRRLTLCLDFLACFVTMLALGLHAVLPVACLIACGALLLALRESLATTRARQAWESMRLRLAGTILTLLGSSLTSFSPDPATLRLGDLLLSIGLCLLAGLGAPGGLASYFDSSLIPPTERASALLDMLLCIAAIALMIRLPERDITHTVLVLAGLAALWLGILARQDGVRSLIALAIVSTAIPGGHVPAMLFLSTGLALAAEPALDSRSRRWVACGLPPWPPFAASCGLLAGLMRSSPLSGGLAALLTVIGLGVMASRSGLAGALPCAWRDRLILLLLLGLGLVAPFLLPAVHTGQDFSLGWMAP